MTTSQLQTEQHQVSDDTAISIQNVTISYGSYEAVKNVYCDVPRGKVTAFIGPSGTGMRYPGSNLARRIRS